MIGQSNLINTIKAQIEYQVFPRFSILVGPKGSGKKYLTRLICNWLNADPVPLGDVKVETIRCMIEDSYNKCNTTVYIISDADDMSLAAKNALLKITEEPPNNCYFIMTLEDELHTLDTIRSRGVRFYMETYTPPQIAQYYELIDKEQKDNSIILNLCTVPGEVNMLCNIGISEFYAYVEKVVDNIAEVSAANSFKISDKLSLKDESDKYDLTLFLKAFRKICMDRACKEYMEDTDSVFNYCVGVAITSVAINECARKGCNKQYIFDSWLFDIRREWM